MASLAELIAHNARTRAAATLNKNIFFCNSIKLMVWLNIKFMRGGGGVRKC